VERLEPLAEQFRRGRDEVSDLGGQVGGIIDDLRVLARKEAELARAELGEQLAISRNALVLGGLALVLAGLSVVFLFLTLMFGLDAGLPLWAAALITTLVLLLSTGLAALLARDQLRRISVVPRRTVDSVSEDVRWARDQLRFNGR
jgi:uncharacterized membrane protein YqjE